MRKVTIVLVLVALFTAAVHADNIALDATATASTAYAANMDGDKTNDGVAQHVNPGIWYTTAWASASHDNAHWLQFSWDSSVKFDEVKVYGIGYSPGNENMDPYDFLIQTSDDGLDWTTIDDVTANKLDVYTYSSPSVIEAQYLRLWITTPNDPNGTPDFIARISEVEVTGATIPEPVTMVLLSLGGIGMCVRRRNNK